MKFVPRNHYYESSYSIEIYPETDIVTQLALRRYNGTDYAADTFSAWGSFTYHNIPGLKLEIDEWLDN